MSDTTSSDGTTQQPADDAVAARSFTQAGYQIQLYQGFVRRSTIAPRGRPAELLYQQEGTFMVPGGAPPAARSNVVLTGGGHSRDVHLQIINEPQDPLTFKGPIATITVQLGRPGPGGPTNNRPDLVQIVRGDDQVVSVQVGLRADGGAGAADATDTGDVGDATVAGVAGASPARLEDDPDETWVIEDNASTCPRNC